ncbi:hypothetical protein [Agilicoccus flavus]|uniref:hypothetical protein n=1 Tax=Agilicoccus flavus TaxID=2775968 RepID=UPI001CF678DF|nr:hypothetical protein [Agilicoccus flavus]
MTLLPNPHNAFGARFLRPGAEDGFSVGYRSAENLLVKARRALVAGDDERAARYIDKAAAIPWDDHEKHVPAIAAAEFALYMTICQAMEGCVEGDDGWIDGPAAVIDSDSLGRRDVSTALRDVASEGLSSRREERRVDRLLAVCAPFELNHDEGDLDHSRRVERLTTLVRASVDVDTAR